MRQSVHDREAGPWGRSGAPLGGLDTCSARAAALVARAHRMCIACAPRAHRMHCSEQALSPLLEIARSSSADVGARAKALYAAACVDMHMDMDMEHGHGMCMCMCM